MLVLVIALVKVSYTMVRACDRKDKNAAGKHTPIQVSLLSAFNAHVWPILPHAYWHCAYTF